VSLINLTLGQVAQLEMNNLPMNLLTDPFLDEFEAALGTLERAGPGEVRVVVVSSASDRSFSAGSDIKGFAGNAGEQGRPHHARDEALTARLANLPMPTIAAIETNCLGGGLELALACDIRVCSERATFGLPEVRLGVTPGAGGTQRLPRAVGVSRAKELALTGRIIDAAEAERIGLVTRVVPAGQAVAAAHEIAREIAQRGPLAVREVKRLVDLSAETDIESGLAAEIDASVRVFSSADMLEGAAAFIEKRQPSYRGE
jgi:enoyl-CoA hydratase/carnithine racemase